MSDLVNPADIERLVGAERHPVEHIAHAVSATGTIYILHSGRCKASGTDLRSCPYSLALDHGVHPSDWHGHEDQAVGAAIIDGRLSPTGLPPGAATTRP